MMMSLWKVVKGLILCSHWIAINTLVHVTGIAKAFNMELQLHPDMLKVLFGIDKAPENPSPWIKMAMVIHQ